MARPLIGVTTYLEQAVRGEWDERFGMVPETYLIAVEEAGGIPLMLPPQPFDDADIARVLGAIDGLVVSGGADVDPGRYGAERGPHTDDPRHDRDDWEVELTLGAIERGVPVLAICRGVQVLNVALGGSLVQHVPDVSEADHGRTPGGFARTEVEITGGTLVRDVLGSVGDRLSVHCHHHQVLDRVADGLVVAAHAPDGLIEAVELPSAPFVVGVQWHPEQHESDRRLFRALVATATPAVPSAGPGSTGPAAGRTLPLVEEARRRRLETTGPAAGDTLPLVEEARRRRLEATARTGSPHA